MISTRVTRRVFVHAAFDASWDHRIALEGMLLESNMVIAGKKTRGRASVDEVTSATLRSTRNSVWRLPGCTGAARELGAH